MYRKSYGLGTDHNVVNSLLISIIVLVFGTLMIVQFTYANANSESGFYRINCDGIYHEIKYYISNGIVDFSKTDSNLGLIISVKDSVNGTITVDIPREFMDQKTYPDDRFFIMINGEEEEKYTEKKEPTVRIITIPLPHGNSKVSIITSGTPESQAQEYKKCFVEGKISPSEAVNVEKIYSLPPKQQIANGIFPQDVVCKEGLQLIFKSKDNSPACVKPQTAEKFVERGWGTMEISNISKKNSKVASLSISPEKTVYEIGEPISITLKNIGTETLTFPDGAYGIRIRGSDGKTIWPGLVTQNEPDLKPNETFTKVWNQLNGRTGEKVKEGNYTIFAPFATPLVIQVSVTNMVEPVSEKTWVEMNPTQCDNPWQVNGTGNIKDYYKKLGITIFDLKIIQWEHEGIGTCAACSCGSFSTLYVSIENSDVERMVDLGFKVSENQNP